MTNVAIIPISSQADATRAIAQARKDVSQDDPDLDSGSEGEDIPDNVTENAEAEVGSAPTTPARETVHARGSSVSGIAEDVIGRRLRFGRFAANWLSRKNLGLPRPGALEQDVPESPGPFVDDSPRLPTDGLEVKDEATTAAVPKDAGDQSDSTRPRSVQTAELLPKLLRYTKLLFASHNFFFAYDYDLTRSFNAQQSRKEHLPFHKIVDPLVCLASNFVGDYLQVANTCSFVCSTFGTDIF